jgi:energy-converting hydrogenase Eha subunit C
MQKKIKLLGIISIIIGSISALLCLSPRTLILALPVGFIGMICSCVYVFIDTRDGINSKKITLGVIGVILSSIPVLLILTFTIIHYFKN